MRIRWLSWILMLVFCFSMVGMGQDASTEKETAAWEFFLGTWEHPLEMGMKHSIRITQAHPSSDVMVDWQRLDPLLGPAVVGAPAVLTFFDSGGNPTDFAPLDLDETEDVCAMAVWKSPINAYGMFFKRQRGTSDPEDLILFVVYRVGNPNQTGANSSRDNYILTMLLTRSTTED